jgi:hypothetical protein
MEEFCSYNLEPLLLDPKKKKQGVDKEERIISSDPDHLSPHLPVCSCSLSPMCLVSVEDDAVGGALFLLFTCSLSRVAGLIRLFCYFPLQSLVPQHK